MGVVSLQTQDVILCCVIGEKMEGGNGGNALGPHTGPEFEPGAPQWKARL